LNDGHWVRAEALSVFLAFLKMWSLEVRLCFFENVVVGRHG
jgi:hypothetical protein